MIHLSIQPKLETNQPIVWEPPKKEDYQISHWDQFRYLIKDLLQSNSFSTFEIIFSILHFIFQSFGNLVKKIWT